MRRRAIVVVMLAMAAAACGRLGRDTPACEFEVTGVPLTLIMEAQAVPTAEYGPCLNELEVGWSYRHLVIESGKARFWLDSDRVGDGFLQVTLQESCDPGSAVPRPGGDERVERYVEVAEEIQPIPITLVPATPDNNDYAAEVGVELSGVHIRGRPLQLSLDDRAASTEARVGEALADGRFAVLLGTSEESQRRLSLHIPGQAEPELGLEFGDVIERIEDHATDGHYNAAWFHLFEGGCIIYEFDAKGPGVEQVPESAERALGVTSLRTLRQVARDQGLRIGPLEYDSEG